MKAYKVSVMNKICLLLIACALSAIPCYSQNKSISVDIAYNRYSQSLLLSIFNQSSSKAYIGNTENMPASGSYLSITIYSDVAEMEPQYYAIRRDGDEWKSLILLSPHSQMKTTYELSRFFDNLSPSVKKQVDKIVVDAFHEKA